MKTLDERFGQNAHLPPLDAWMANPYDVEKFYTPTDDRGFIIPDAAIESVLELFDGSYRWPVDWHASHGSIMRPDDHHFHWIADNYDKKKFKGRLSSVPDKFRNLPTNRGIIPRQFHNALHFLTIPPHVPKLGYMAHYLHSFEIARSLFSSTSRMVQAEALFDETTEDRELESYMRRYSDIFQNYEVKIRDARRRDALGAIGIENGFYDAPLHELNNALGSCALLNTPNYTATYFSDAVLAA